MDVRTDVNNEMSLETKCYTQKCHFWHSYACWKKLWLPIFRQTVNEIDLHFQGQTFRISLICYCFKMAEPRKIIMFANVCIRCYLIDFQQNFNCPWPNLITSLSNLSSETYQRMPTAIFVRGHTMDKIEGRHLSNLIQCQL